MGDHSERAHSKFSASGSERWLNCAYSVEAEENSPPSKDSFWSKEGTLAHEVLEAMLLRKPIPSSFDVSKEMIGHVQKVVNKIRAIQGAFGGRLFVEQKVFASYIHPDMFGTLDTLIAGDDHTLHIGDFKYGQTPVKAEKNTQLIQYALSVAESYNWEHFSHVKMWIFQPRIGGEKWFDSWTITMKDLKSLWLPVWQKGVERVTKGASKPFAGSWCHYCRARYTCPAKAANQMKKVSNAFKAQPLEGSDNGIKEKSKKEKSQAFHKAKKEAQEKSFDTFGQSFDEG